MNKTVKDGKWQHFSASSISKFDTSQDGGCLRKGYYRYVLGEQEPPSKGQKLGLKYHKEIEDYLKTGVKALSRTVLAGFEYLPSPDDDVLIEFPIKVSEQRSKGLKIFNPLHVAGVEIKGYIDIVNQSGRTVTCTGRIIEEPDVVEILDWKFTKDLCYAKNAKQLQETVQMPLYAKWAYHNRAHFPKLKRVRISHGSFCTKSLGALKTTTLIDQTKVEKQIERISSVARVMKDVALETDVEKVPANKTACSAYGGCAFRSFCSAGGMTIEDQGGIMSILDKIKPVEPEVAREIEKLEAAEHKDPLLVAIEEVREYDMGVPMLKGSAAEAYECAAKQAWAGGDGVLKDVTLTEAQQIYALLEELRETYPNVKPIQIESSEQTVAALLPPETPQSDPTAKVEDKNKKEEKPKTKRGRPKGSSKKKTEKVVTETASDLSVFVDCVVADCPTLDAYIESLCAAINEQYDCDDMRMAGDGPLSFGKWKGVLSAVARQKLPEPGMYTVDTRGSEIAETVVNALKPLCKLYVRGLR